MEDLSWEVRDSEVAYACPGFDVIHEDVRLPDGTETDFDYLSEPPAVVLVPFTEDGDLVVIEEWRQAVERVNRGLPAGGTESADVDLETAARRELAEETGYEAGSLERLVSVEPANGFANSVHHYFVARDCTPTAEQDLDHDETIRVDTTTVDAMRESIREDDVSDGRTVLGLLAYQFFS
mgnify:CR=1 FL=1